MNRGASYASATYQRYVKAVGNHRKTATTSDNIVLDLASSHLVEIDFAALNGDRLQTSNENDLSLVAVVHYDQFTAEIGGDLSGYENGSYKDIETSVAPKVGVIQVYKVHHHCSRYSTNDTWLSTTKPELAIISVGDGNDYGHPTDECLERLHQAGVKTYWTEKGNGATPEAGYDKVGGTIIVEVAADATSFTVRPQQGTADSYPLPGAVEPPKEVKYVWSKKSSVYHYATCRYAQSISPENLMTGSTPPEGKTLHKDCPK